ncbi:cyclase family protein [Striga asiatica]|uniref:Cyclase family protein n=1 Tax=Striga asiatica TaxID=4170 RepID=A0A5A7QA92_STRAF|nr:cyclase family protein [Striga asiatica]
MRSVQVFLICLVLQTIPALSSSSNYAYPCGYGDGSSDCVGVHENEEIFDITHKFTPHTPVGDSTDGIGQFLTLLMSMKNGSDYNFSEMKIPVHSGTHVDAPGHMYDNYYDEGCDVDSLDLRVLNGPALLVDVPRDKNITAEVMESLNIPKGVKRVLFRTLNTDRGLMYRKAFDTSYVGFMKDGAQWLVDNTDIKLVGLDYLSVAAFDDLIPSHLVFLKSKKMKFDVRAYDRRACCFKTFPLNQMGCKISDLEDNRNGRGEAGDKLCLEDTLRLGDKVCLGDRMRWEDKDKRAGDKAVGGVRRDLEGKKGNYAVVVDSLLWDKEPRKEEDMPMDEKYNMRHVMSKEVRSKRTE